MPRSFWDDDVNPDGVILPSQINLAEHAARVGSIVTFNRMGDVMWLDGFEDGLGKWVLNTSGTGAAAVLSTAAARNGGYSALLTAGTTNTMLIGLWRYTPFPVVSKLGIEVSFALRPNVANIEIRQGFLDGTLLLNFAVRYRLSEADLQYYNSAAGWTTFATGINLPTSIDLFNNAKLVIDPDAVEYVRFTLNATQYSLAGIAGHSMASAAEPHTRTYITLTGDSGGNRQAYIDDVILTQNEP